MTVDASTVRDRYARWQENVAGVLAKSTRKAVEDLPADPERLLDTPTYDGFPVRPLYTSLDGLAEPSLPGHWPFTRGGDAHRDVLAGWKVTESFPIAGDVDVATVNGAVTAVSLLYIIFGAILMLYTLEESGGIRSSIWTKRPKSRHPRPRTEAPSRAVVCAITGTEYPTAKG